MNHPALALQGEIYSKLANSNSLTALLGGVHIFDDVPSSKKPPYIVFADYVLTDWSTGTEPGMEHDLALHVWSGENGRKEALLIVEEIKSALSNLPNVLTNHALINFTHQFTEIARDKDTGFFLAKVNFRGVTEPS